MDSIAQAAQLYDFFAARGLSSDQARQCLADQAKAEDIVKKSAAQSDELGVNGTPTFFINGRNRSEEHTSELQSLMRISYAVFCLTKKKHINTHIKTDKTLH